MGGSGNKLLPIGAALLAAFLALVFLRPSQQTAPPASAPRQAPAPDADSAADTLRAMAVQVKELRAQAEAERRDTASERTRQADEIARLRKVLQDEQTRAVDQQRGRDTQTQALADKLEEISRRLTPGGAPNAGPAGPDARLPIGGADTSLTWIDPLDQAPGRKPVPPTATARPAAAGGSLLHDGSAPASAVKPPVPFHTVPRNATLLGSTALTALIGRVPNRGQVEDPFPFKVLVGRDNLAANGLEIPHVFGMVFAGTAFGDWTLGCVRGHVDSVTFVFDDGTIRTISDSGSGGTGQGGATAQTGASGGAAGTATIHRGLGWISDRRGIPCVSGRRISNAVDYLGGRMLAHGVETAGKAYARSQQTFIANPLGGITSEVTGDPAKYALGETAAGSASELAQFIAERQAQQFDVVYVDTGAEVAVHLDRELQIDYDPNGRKLDYARATPLPNAGRGGLD
jgi:integrating conjugative element protein (TIGR03752 family)